MPRSKVLFGLAFTLVISVLGVAPAEGDWTFIGPEPVGSSADLFYSIDATAPGDVWAVGFWEPPDSDRRSLIEHFDGVEWTQLPTPDTGVVGPFEHLTGVVAVDPSQAVAVGSYTPVGPYGQPLSMEWDGVEWDLLSSPVFEGGGTFQAVDQSPSGEIWAAGFDFGRALVARKNGTSWDVEFAPPVGSGNRFYAVHAFADDEVWAVGTYGSGSGNFRILIQRYDGGSSWTTFNVPTPGYLDELTGVIAFASNDVWATGYYYHPTLLSNQPLVMHYDGAAWTQVELPPYLDGSASLRGMTANGPSDIFAAGTYSLPDGTPRPFMLHYDGLSWSDVSLPPTGGSHEWFRGMGATPDGVVMAVGQYYDGSSTEPMAFFRDDRTTAVENPVASSGTALVGSFPNPFVTETSVRFGVPRSGQVRLRILNASGRLVRTLADREMAPGSYTVGWDGLDAEGRSVATGVYFYVLETDDVVAERKVIRVK